MNPIHPKESKMRELFDTISPRYDLFNRVSSLGQDCAWREKSIRLGEVTAGMTVLDIGTGTGDFSVCAAGKIGPSGRIYGMDIAPEMLKQSAAKIKVPFLPVLARAEQIPFQPASVDCIIMAFVLRNVSDVDKTLRECLKVLDSRGKLIVLEITRPANRAVEILYRFYMGKVVPRMGDLLCGKRWPFDYLNQSVMMFQSPQEIAGAMKRVGFASVKIFPLTMGVVHVVIGEK
ncbi:MAG: ubiquinone/menaquinone biosynthesis methyltransferase [Candidatus Omnitrophica bacterium]|nr:ubiquinone/menaquinone biosynthesis methyltransferase [Candidatus Omnitrophota bacterium]